MRLAYGFLICLLTVNRIQAQFFPLGSPAQCLNPNNTPGVCIPIFQCPALMSAIQRTPLSESDQQFLRASACFGGFLNVVQHVCCTTDSGYAASTGLSNWQSPQIRVPPAQAFPTAPLNTQASRPNKQSTNNKRAGNRGSQGTSSRSALLPQPPTCGGVTIGNKIYGGVDAELFEFPWMVRLAYQRNSGGSGLSINCAGSLINNRYVLTAAHCVKGAIERQVGKVAFVRLGEHDTTTKIDCNQNTCADQSYLAAVEQVIPHERYIDGSSNQENDIALLRLNRNINFSDSVRPVCLPSMVPATQSKNLRFTVAGWGKTLKSSKSTIKRKVDVSPVDQQQCRRKFQEHKVDIVSSQLCAGGKFAEDSCEGDSGGPLMHFHNGAWVLEGVVSFGYKCGLNDWPGVYTRVLSYDNWIRNKIRP